MTKEYKKVPYFELKLDEEKGIVDHIFAVMGNIDLGGDVIHSGAFKKTIHERGNDVLVLDSHNTNSVKDAIAKPILIKEISRHQLPKEVKEKFPEATGGVQARTQFFLDDPDSKAVFNRLKNKAISEWSFGYDALDKDYSKVEDKDGNEVTVRNLRTIKLYEYSPVLWGMNEGTTTLSAKDDKNLEDKEDEKDEKVVPTEEINLSLDKTLDTSEENKQEKLNKELDNETKEDKLHTSGPPVILGPMITAKLFEFGTDIISHWLKTNNIRIDELTVTTNGLLAAMDTLNATIPEDILSRQFDSGPQQELSPFMFMDGDINLDTKAGRTISARNERRMMTAIESLQSSVDTLTSILDDAGLMNNEESSSHRDDEEKQNGVRPNSDLPTQHVTLDDVNLSLIQLGMLED